MDENRKKDSAINPGFVSVKINKSKLKNSTKLTNLFFKRYGQPTSYDCYVEVRRKILEEIESDYDTDLETDNPKLNEIVDRLGKEIKNATLEEMEQTKKVNKSTTSGRRGRAPKSNKSKLSIEEIYTQSESEKSYNSDSDLNSAESMDDMNDKTSNTEIDTVRRRSLRSYSANKSITESPNSSLSNKVENSKAKSTSDDVPKNKILTKKIVSARKNENLDDTVKDAIPQNNLPRNANMIVKKVIKNSSSSKQVQSSNNNITISETNILKRQNKITKFMITRKQSKAMTNENLNRSENKNIEKEGTLECNMISPIRETDITLNAANKTASIQKTQQSNDMTKKQVTPINIKLSTINSSSNKKTPISASKNCTPSRKNATILRDPLLDIDSVKKNLMSEIENLNTDQLTDMMDSQIISELMHDNYDMFETLKDSAYPIAQSTRIDEVAGETISRDVFQNSNVQISPLDKAKLLKSSTPIDSCKSKQHISQFSKISEETEQDIKNLTENVTNQQVTESQVSQVPTSPNILYSQLPATQVAYHKNLPRVINNQVLSAKYVLSKNQKSDEVPDANAINDSSFNPDNLSDCSNESFESAKEIIDPMEFNSNTNVQKDNDGTENDQISPDHQDQFSNIEIDEKTEIVLNVSKELEIEKTSEVRIPTQNQENDSTKDEESIVCSQGVNFSNQSNKTHLTEKEEANVTGDRKDEDYHMSCGSTSYDDVEMEIEEPLQVSCFEDNKSTNLSEFEKLQKNKKLDLYDSGSESEDEIPSSLPLRECSVRLKTSDISSSEDSKDHDSANEKCNFKSPKKSLLKEKSTNQKNTKIKKTPVKVSPSKSKKSIDKDKNKSNDEQCNNEEDIELKVESPLKSIQITNDIQRVDDEENDEEIDNKEDPQKDKINKIIKLNLLDFDSDSNSTVQTPISNVKPRNDETKNKLMKNSSIALTPENTDEDNDLAKAETSLDEQMSTETQEKIQQIHRLNLSVDDDSESSREVLSKKELKKLEKQSKHQSSVSPVKSDLNEKAKKKRRKSNEKKEDRSKVNSGDEDEQEKLKIEEVQTEEQTVPKESDNDKDEIHDLLNENTVIHPENEDMNVTNLNSIDSYIDTNISQETVRKIQSVSRLNLNYSSESESETEHPSFEADTSCRMKKEKHKFNKDVVQVDEEGSKLSDKEDRKKSRKRKTSERVIKIDEDEDIESKKAIPKVKKETQGKAVLNETKESLDDEDNQVKKVKKRNNKKKAASTENCEEKSSDDERLKKIMEGIEQKNTSKESCSNKEQNDELHTNSVEHQENEKEENIVSQQSVDSYIDANISQDTVRKIQSVNRLNLHDISESESENEHPSFEADTSCRLKKEKHKIDENVVQVDEDSSDLSDNEDGKLSSKRKTREASIKKDEEKVEKEKQSTAEEATKHKLDDFYVVKDKSNPKKKREISLTTPTEADNLNYVSHVLRKNYYKNKYLVEASLKESRKDTDDSKKQIQNFDEYKKYGWVEEYKDFLFELDDLSDSEEVYVFDMPAKSFTNNLKGKKISLKNDCVIIGSTKYPLEINEDVVISTVTQVKTNEKKYKTKNMRIKAEVNIKKSAKSQRKAASTSVTDNTIKSTSVNKNKRKADTNLTEEAVDVKKPKLDLCDYNDISDFSE